MSENNQSSNEWTEQLKLDFLRTFFADDNSILSDSSRSGFHQKYSTWCQNHGISSSNERGGYSFYGKLEDLMWNCSPPDDAWNTYELTDKGRDLLKRDLEHSP